MIRRCRIDPADFTRVPDLRIARCRLSPRNRTKISRERDWEKEKEEEAASKPGQAESEPCVAPSLRRWTLRRRDVSYQPFGDRQLSPQVICDYKYGFWRFALCFSGLVSMAQLLIRGPINSKNMQETRSEKGRPNLPLARRKIDEIASPGCFERTRRLRRPE